MEIEVFLAYLILVLIPGLFIYSDFSNKKKGFVQTIVRISFVIVIGAIFFGWVMESNSFEPNIFIATVLYIVTPFCFGILFFYLLYKIWLFAKSVKPR